MSATAFQRMRRNAENQETDVSKLKIDELRELCKKKGIEVDSKAKKDELLKILEGAE
jgi:hypothetical protein